jgi:hypothetical protein
MTPGPLVSYVLMMHIVAQLGEGGFFLLRSGVLRVRGRVRNWKGGEVGPGGGCGVYWFCECRSMWLGRCSWELVEVIGAWTMALCLLLMCNGHSCRIRMS